MLLFLKQNANIFLLYERTFIIIRVARYYSSYFVKSCGKQRSKKFSAKKSGSYSRIDFS